MLQLIVGCNGAVKSTLLKCLNPILVPRKGTVLIDGNDVAYMMQHERARRFGFLPQESLAGLIFCR